ncbi:MAG: outer membrane protein assembly factor BamD [Planctomycetaceae bacterium]|nr:outer membrane protein assembly factor BamD [Planctomycetaceae bacterium]
MSEIRSFVVADMQVTKKHFIVICFALVILTFFAGVNETAAQYALPPATTGNGSRPQSQTPSLSQFSQQYTQPAFSNPAVATSGQPYQPILNPSATSDSSTLTPGQPETMPAQQMVLYDPKNQNGYPQFPLQQPMPAIQPQGFPQPSATQQYQPQQPYLVAMSNQPAIASPRPDASSFTQPMTTPVATTPAVTAAPATPMFTVPAYRPDSASPVPGGSGQSPLIAFNSNAPIGAPVGHAFAADSPASAEVSAELKPAFVSAPGTANTTSVEVSDTFKIPKKERPKDRLTAEEEQIRKYNDIMKNRNTDGWMKPLPSYGGPLDFRAVGKKGGDEEQSIVSVNFEMYDKSLKQDERVYDWEAEEKHWFDASLLDPTRLGEHMKAWIGLGPNEGKARQHMQDGLKLFEQKEYMKAGNEFEWAAYYSPKTIIAEDARYHAAECYYQAKAFPKAVKQYTLLITEFQSSPYKPEAVKNLFEIAKKWVKDSEEGYWYLFVNVTDKSRPAFDTFGNAKKAFETIYINDPRGPLADDSIYTLGIALMRRAKFQGDISYEQAADTFRILRDTCPNSEFIVEAMRLETICRKRSSAGTAYSSQPYREAAKLADQTLQQFGTAITPEQRDDLIRVRGEITVAKARQIWEIGQYYDGQKNYGAAKYKYNEVIDQYPSTDYAEKARKRLNVIRDYPDEPESDWQRIKSWVTFGRSSATKEN